MKISRKILPLCCLLCFLSLPAWSQQSTASTQDELAQSWTAFDEIITNLKDEIANLKQEIESVKSSSSISIRKRDELILSLQTQLSEREAELRDLRQRYELSKNGEASTSLLNGKLSADLKAARLKFGISVGVNIALLILAGFLIFH